MTRRAVDRQLLPMHSYYGNGKWGYTAKYIWTDIGMEQVYTYLKTRFLKY